MYKYVNPQTEGFQTLADVGADLAIEILEMIPDDIRSNLVQLKAAIDGSNYLEIQRFVHTIKSNLRHLMDVDHEFLVFVQDFENRVKVYGDEQKSNGSVAHAFDFTADYEKLNNGSLEALAEILLFTQEYKSQN